MQLHFANQVLAFDALSSVILKFAVFGFQIIWVKNQSGDNVGFIDQKTLNKYLSEHSLQEVHKKTITAGEVACSIEDLDQRSALAI